MEAGTTSQTVQMDSSASAQNKLSESTNPPQKEKKTSNFKAILKIAGFLIICIVIFGIITSLFKIPTTLDKIYSCGNEVKICPSGDLSEKTGPKCEFSKCPDTKIDVSDIWDVKQSTSDLNRVYTNSILNYSFEAPKDWKFQGQKHDFDLYSPNYRKVYDDGVQTIYKGSVIKFNIYTFKTKDESVEEWFKKNVRENKNKKEYAKYSYVNTKIAEKNVIEETYEYNNKQSKIYFFLDNGKIYSLGFNSHDKKSNDNYQHVFNQILSTFKFIKQDISLDSADRDSQRTEDISLISFGIIKYKAANKKLPENLSELKASGFEVPVDPLTGESYRYFKNNSNGGYFTICYREENKSKPHLFCIKNGGSYYGQSDHSDADMQDLADREVEGPMPTTSPRSIANDKKRQEDTLSILNAIYKYKDAHQGNFPKEILHIRDIDKFFDISSDEVDLCMELVPTYLSAFPQDPTFYNGKVINSCSYYTSGYEISVGEDNAVIIIAPGTEKPNALIYSYK